MAHLRLARVGDLAERQAHPASYPVLRAASQRFLKIGGGVNPAVPVEPCEAALVQPERPLTWDSRAPVAVKRLQAGAQDGVGFRVFSGPDCRRSLLEDEQPVSRIGRDQLAKDTVGICMAAFSAVDQGERRSGLDERARIPGCGLDEPDAFVLPAAEAHHVGKHPRG